MTTTVEAYRARNPRSRAERDYTLYGSTSCIRRATCVYCRTVIATCSARWPETKGYRAAIDAHDCAQRETYRIIAAHTAI